MELLMQLAHFDPHKRATPLDVLNLQFMASLQEDPNEETKRPGENVLCFMPIMISIHPKRKNSVVRIGLTKYGFKGFSTCA
jgi:hypothetical protein